MQQEHKNISEDKDTISLKELILAIKGWASYLNSKNKIILLLLFVGGVLGVAFALTKKTLYTATTTFVLEEGEQGGGMGNLGGLASMVGIDVAGGGGLFTGDNIIELYKSRAMIQQAILSRSAVKPGILLVDWYIDINHLKEEWQSTNWSKVDFHEKNSNIVKDSVLREIVKTINKDYLSVGKPDKKLSKIQVEVRAPDELFAKEFSYQIVNAVNNFYIQTKTKRSTKNVVILQHKVDSVRNVMNGAIYTSAAITDATPNLNPTRQIQRTAPSQKAQFSAETNKNILSEMLKNLEISKMSLLKETPLIQVIDEPILPLERSKLSKIKSAIIGSFLLAGLFIIFLTIKLIYKKILS